MEETREALSNTVKLSFWDFFIRFSILFHSKKQMIQSLCDTLYDLPIDYAVDIFHQALRMGKFEVNLSEETRLPMIYIPDVIKATADLIEAPSENLTIRTYNIGVYLFLFSFNDNFIKIYLI